MSAGHTAGPWQTKHDYSLEGLATIIANVDGEIIEGSNHYTYDTVAICADEFGEYLPNAASNARLIVAACNSYDRHFGSRAIEAAEADLLGSLIDESQFLIDRLNDFEKAITSETDASEFDGHVKPSVSRLQSILSQAHPTEGAAS